MPDTDDKGLDANALVMKRALLAGVVGEEQKLRQQITQLQKGEGVDLAAAYLGGLDLEGATGVPAEIASDLLKMMLKVVKGGIGEKTSAMHMLCVVTRDAAALVAEGEYGDPKLNRFEQMAVTIRDILEPAVAQEGWGPPRQH